MKKTWDSVKLSTHNIWQQNGTQVVAVWSIHCLLLQHPTPLDQNNVDKLQICERRLRAVGGARAERSCIEKSSTNRIVAYNYMTAEWNPIHRLLPQHLHLLRTKTMLTNFKSTSGWWRKSREKLHRKVFDQPTRRHFVPRSRLRRCRASCEKQTRDFQIWCNLCLNTHMQILPWPT